MSGVDPLYHSRQMTLMATRLATAELFKDQLCDWMITNSHQAEVMRIRDDVNQTVRSAGLEFQKKLGVILRDFGVDNPL